MEHDFWHERWRRREIGFNQPAPHALLQKHGQALTGKVLVPLCGKSVDMLWLRGEGHEVAGLELSPIACEEFFTENGLPFTRDGQIFRGDGITLYCGDFFAAPEEAWRGVGSVYDRAALVALPRQMRQRYAKAFDEPVLLISFAFPQPGGPPFSVPEDEIRKLYGSHALRALESHEIDLRSGRATETAYLLEPH